MHNRQENNAQLLANGKRKKELLEEIRKITQFASKRASYIGTLQAGRAQWLEDNQYCNNSLKGMLDQSSARSKALPIIPKPTMDYISHLELVDSALIDVNSGQALLATFSNSLSAPNQALLEANQQAHERSLTDSKNDMTQYLRDLIAYHGKSGLVELEKQVIASMMRGYVAKVSQAPKRAKAAAAPKEHKNDKLMGPNCEKYWRFTGETYYTLDEIVTLSKALFPNERFSIPASFQSLELAFKAELAPVKPELRIPTPALKGDVCGKLQSIFGIQEDDVKRLFEGRVPCDYLKALGPSIQSRIKKQGPAADAVKTPVDKPVVTGPTAAGVNGASPDTMSQEERALLDLAKQCNQEAMVALRNVDDALSAEIVEIAKDIQEAQKRADEIIQKARDEADCVRADALTFAQQQTAPKEQAISKEDKKICLVENKLLEGVFNYVFVKIVFWFIFFLC